MTYPRAYVVKLTNTKTGAMFFSLVYAPLLWVYVKTYLQLVGEMATHWELSRRAVLVRSIERYVQE